MRSAPSGPLALVARSEELAPNVLSVRHWERLRSGALLANSPRIDWATLMRRTFDVDVLACARCGGRVKVLGVVDDPETVRTILSELGISSAPPCVRARDPTTLSGDDESDESA